MDTINEYYRCYCCYLRVDSGFAFTVVEMIGQVDWSNLSHPYFHSVGGTNLVGKEKHLEIFSYDAFSVLNFESACCTRSCVCHCVLSWVQGVRGYS